MPVTSSDMTHHTLTNGSPKLLTSCPKLLYFQSHCLCSDVTSCPAQTHLCSVLSSGLASSLTDLYSAHLEEDRTYLPSFPPTSSSSSPLAPPPSSRPRPQEPHAAFRAPSGRYLSRSIPVSPSAAATTCSSS